MASCPGPLQMASVSLSGEKKRRKKTPKCLLQPVSEGEAVSSGPLRQGVLGHRATAAGFFGSPLFRQGSEEPDGGEGGRNEAGEKPDRALRSS